VLPTASASSTSGIGGGIRTKQILLRLWQEEPQRSAMPHLSVLTPLVHEPSFDVQKSLVYFFKVSKGTPIYVTGSGGL
jgi:hypothetical protein